LDVDGHVLVYNPKKGAATARLVWPPVTNAPTRLTIKAGQTLTNQYSGLWSLFRLLDTADKQEGGLFVFSTIQISNGGNRNTLQDNKGNPVTVQIRVDSPAAAAFTKRYFGKLRCENFAGWALR
jgi:type VI protein secretion system component VasK